MEESKPPFDWRALAEQHYIGEREAQILWKQAVRQRLYYDWFRREEDIFLALLEMTRAHAPAADLESNLHTPGKTSRDAGRVLARANGRRRLKLMRPADPGKVRLRSLSAFVHRELERTRARNLSLDVARIPGRKGDETVEQDAAQPPVEATRDPDGAWPWRSWGSMKGR
jgi:hypothetical protein